jgi:hypothetical protein
VLRPEERTQLHVWIVGKSIRCVPKGVVYRGGIRDDADALARDELPIAIQQDIYSEASGCAFD